MQRDIQRVLEDLENYYKFLVQDDVEKCLEIESRYGLDGYSPEIVCAVLHAGGRGQDMDEMMERLFGS
jgi:hypothetical protein